MVAFYILHSISSIGFLTLFIIVEFYLCLCGILLRKRSCFINRAIIHRVILILPPAEFIINIAIHAIRLPRISVCTRNTGNTGGDTPV